MATFFLGLAGSTFFGPIGGFIGGLAGSVVDSFLFPPQDITIEGPRLDDLKVTSSTYGKKIPILYGTREMGGNLVWSTDLVEHRIEETTGGKKGKQPEVTTVTFKYTVSGRINFCEGAAQAILNVRGDFKPMLSTDASVDNPVVSFLISKGDDSPGNPAVRFYFGEESQLPGPAEQSDKGINSTPAYRGQVGIEFQDLLLENFGNRWPQITAEIAMVASDSKPAITRVENGSTSTFRFAWQPGDLTAIFMDGTNKTARIDMVGGEELARADYPDLGTPHIDETGVVAVDSAGDFYLHEFVGVIGTRRTVKYDGTTLVRSNHSPLFLNPDLTTFTTGVAPHQLIWAHGLIYTWFQTGGDYSYQSDLLADPGIVIEHGYGSATFVRARHDENGDVWAMFSSGGSPATYTLQKYVGGAPTDTIVVDVLNGLGASDFLHYEDEDAVVLIRYDPLTGYVAKYDRASGALLGSVADVTLDGFSVSGVAARKLAGTTLFLNATEFAFRSVDLADMSSEAFLVQDWVASPPQTAGAIYDPHYHAIVRYDKIGAVTLYWLLLDRKTGSSTTLQAIVEDISGRMGLTAGTDIDASALTDGVLGYVVQRTSARRAIEPLFPIYQFDAREEDFVMEFVKRGGASVVTVAEEELAARGFDETGPISLIEEERFQELELPRRVEILYSDPDFEYQENQQQFLRASEAVQTDKRMTVDARALVLDTDEAAQRVEQLGSVIWTGRERYSVNVTRRHARISPGDPIQATADGVTFSFRVEEMEVGAGVIRLRGPADDAAIYSSSITGAAARGLIPSTFKVGGLSQFYLIDRPMVRDLDDALGIYIAGGSMTSLDWPGMAVLRSADGSTFDEVVTGIASSRNATHGIAETALPDWTGGYRWDRDSTVTVRLYNGTVSSSTESAVLDGANFVLIGNEYLQFVNAMPLGNDRYTLDTFLRGRRGTEAEIPVHATSERFVVMSESTIVAEPVDASLLGLLRYYAGLTFGSTKINDSIQKQLTFAGASLKPYSVVHIEGDNSGSPDDWIITWLRRARTFGEWRDELDVPLGEESEEYVVEFLDTSGSPEVVVRTKTVTSETVTYTEAEQTADFGAPQSAITVRIYQVSATVGRGFPATAELAA